MKIRDEFPGAFNFLKCIGLKNEESVLILTDELSNIYTIKLLRKIFTTKCSKVCIDILPKNLQEDFPYRICEEIKKFDVIILAASQSWYHVPTRRKAKYKYKKRIIECYNLTLEMLKKGALCADYKNVSLITRNLRKSFLPNSLLTINTKEKGKFIARMKNIFQETGYYNKSGSGGNLPAGEISFGIIKGSASGEIIFNVSFDNIGRLEKYPLRVLIDKDKVISVHGKFKKVLEDLFLRDIRLKNIAEIGIGTNPYAILGHSVLEDEKKIGTVHIGFGNNTYFGGTVGGPHFDGVFSPTAIMVDEKPLIF